jgi:hypothetical protein
MNNYAPQKISSRTGEAHQSFRSTPRSEKYTKTHKLFEGNIYY